jgi:hypothetical protein
MLERVAKASEWLLGREAPAEGPRTHLLPRWIFLRTLGLIYFSAFYSLIFQIKGLIGPNGILPATDYLVDVNHYYPGVQRFWFAPTLLWIGSGNHALMLITWFGLAASVAVILNLWPRAALAVCFVCFVSFVAAAQDFSGYQSDGMLLEAGFISLFFVPAGFRPGLGATHAPSRLSLFLLRWEWFRIYFESGVVKLTSGDYSWRHLTAMDDYYQNGPLPTWVGWYVQQLPHWFHAATAFMTLAAELGLVWMLFLPRRFRILCFCIVTPFQMGIILTANYTFLNYLVLCLGFLLLDDGFVRRILSRVPLKWKLVSTQQPAEPVIAKPRAPHWLQPVWRGVAGIYLLWIAYATTALLCAIVPYTPRLPLGPARALDPFRIANQYGLFAVMTHERYELEYQGTTDGQNWFAYPFRYKPQDVYQPPGIYAPYQPRFDWDLWFASLSTWRNYPFVVQTEERLLRNDRDVLALFAGNPFASAPPTKVRVVVWQYWFTNRATKKADGTWWTRKLLGIYAPPLEKTPDGQVVMSPQ